MEKHSSFFGLEKSFMSLVPGVVTKHDVNNDKLARAGKVITVDQHILDTHAGKQLS
jgi:hypothetical protein